MSTKADFSVAEWEMLREVPHLVIFAMTFADDSGFFGTIAEAFAPSELIAHAMEGDNSLLHALCEKDEVVSAIRSIKSRAKKAGDLNDIRAALHKEAVNTARSAVELLSQKGTPADLAAYKEFVIALADKVANAAKEGGFLGFGGERVSANEQTILDELAEAVGVFQA